MLFLMLIYQLTLILLPRYKKHTICYPLLQFKVKNKINGEVAEFQFINFGIDSLHLKQK